MIISTIPERDGPMVSGHHAAAPPPAANKPHGLKKNELAAGEFDPDWWAQPSCALSPLQVQRAHVAEGRELTSTDEPPMCRVLLTQKPPLSTGRTRRPRPGDVALLGGLLGGGQAVAVPWAVGLGAGGALASPMRGPKPIAPVDAGAPSALGEMGRIAIDDVGPKGFRLQHGGLSGVPWGLGHWPFLPRLGLGGQVARYGHQSYTVSQTVSLAEAQAVVRRTETWWWRLAHLAGVDVGPLAAPTPPLRLDAPLDWLQPHDTATLTRGTFWLLSVGVVSGWLRVGPQKTGQASRSLRLTRHDGARLSAELIDPIAGQQQRLVVDLPILAALYSDAGSRTERRRFWRLDLNQAEGRLSYRLIVDAYLEGGPGPCCPADADYLQTLRYRGHGATLFLPWTLLSTPVRGLGRVADHSVSELRRTASSRPVRSVRVDCDTESPALGHTAWRVQVGIDPHSPQSADAPIALAVCVRLELDRVDATKKAQLVALLHKALGAPFRPPTRVLSAGEGQVGTGLNIDIDVPLDTNTLWRLEREAAPWWLASTATSVRTTLEAVQALRSALARGALYLAGDDNQLPGEALMTVLKRVGPEAMLLLARWAQGSHGLRINVNYEQTDALVEQALALAVKRPARGETSLLFEAQRVSLLSALNEATTQLLTCPLLALAEPACLQEQRDRLGRAQQALTDQEARAVLYGALI